VHLGLWRIVGSREGFPKFYLCSGRVTGIHVRQVIVNGKAQVFLFALWRARCESDQNRLLRTFASRLMVSALGRTGHPFAVSSSEEPSQMIEFVFSANPETNRRASTE
jgi:hypothetical protein